MTNQSADRIVELVADIETPAVLIDDAVVQRNIERFQAHCDEQGLRLRPHIKTHKLPEIARRQLEAGAAGITCQKISEAEVMADAGFDDILITYNVVGSRKLERLRALAERVPKLAVVADNGEVIDALSAAFRSGERPLPVLVECDTGAGRCGVQSAEQAYRLASYIAVRPGLVFAGLMTYPPDGGVERVQAFFDEARQQLAEAGIDCPIVSSGGSPDMWRAGDVRGVTEYRIGTYVYNDRSLVEQDVCKWADCALTVLVTVVSTPAPGRAVIDAGSKSLTSDLLGLDGYGHVLGHGDVRITGLSEEHGKLAWEGGQRFAIGDRLRIVPNHACPVSNLVDHVWIGDPAGEATRHDVAARGRVV